MNFSVFIYIAIVVYFIAINVYGIIIMKIQKDAREFGEEHGVNDFRLFFTAILGGATGIFSSMLIMRYRIKNIILMTGLPVLIVFNVFSIVYLFSQGATWFSAIRP